MHLLLFWHLALIQSTAYFVTCGYLSLSLGLLKVFSTGFGVPAFHGSRTRERRRRTERAAPSVRPAAASGDGQRCCRLDLLHREARGDVLERHRADQALIEG